MRPLLIMRFRVGYRSRDHQHREDGAGNRKDEKQREAADRREWLVGGRERAGGVCGQK